VQWNPRLIYADVTGFGEKAGRRSPGLRHHVVLGAQRALVDDARFRCASDLAGCPASGDNATAVGLYPRSSPRSIAARHGKEIVRHDLAARQGLVRQRLIVTALCGAKFYGLHDRKNPANAAMNVTGLPTSTWFVLLVTPDKLAAVAKAIGRTDLLTDPRFSDPAKLIANMPELTTTSRRRLRRTADGALVRGLQWGPRHVRRGARSGGGDRRSSAAAQ
jgi:formyl-CoA transferase